MRIESSFNRRKKRNMLRNSRGDRSWLRKDRGKRMKGRDRLQKKKRRLIGRWLWRFSRKNNYKRRSSPAMRRREERKLKPGRLKESRSKKSSIDRLRRS